MKKISNREKSFFDIKKGKPIFKSSIIVAIFLFTLNVYELYIIFKLKKYINNKYLEHRK